MVSVIVQKWEESELGWGVRPDGYTIHLSEPDRSSFIEDYWGNMPKGVPDEYSRPSGSPYLADVSEEDVKDIGKGRWFTHNNYPGSGGSDGWVPYKGKLNEHS